jgi:hypothetical protein
MKRACPFDSPQSIKKARYINPQDTYIQNDVFFTEISKYLTVSDIYNLYLCNSNYYQKLNNNNFWGTYRNFTFPRETLSWKNSFKSSKKVYKDQKLELVEKMILSPKIKSLSYELLNYIKNFGIYTHHIYELLKKIFSLDKNMISSFKKFIVLIKNKERYNHKSEILSIFKEYIIKDDRKDNIFTCFKIFINTFYNLQEDKDIFEEILNDCVKKNLKLYIEYLLSKGPNLEESRSSLLENAIKYCDLEFIKLLFKNNVKYDKLLILTQSIYRKDKQIFEYILEKLPIDIITDTEKDTFYHVCIDANQLDFMKIIDKKITKESNLNIINTVSDTDGTPLYFTCKKGLPQFTSYLIKNGADPNIKSKNYETPLYIAIKNNHYDCIKILCDNGANLNNIYGQGTLDFAKEHSEGCVAILKYYLQPQKE